MAAAMEDLSTLLSRLGLEQYQEALEEEGSPRSKKIDPTECIPTIILVFPPSPFPSPSPHPSGIDDMGTLRKYTDDELVNDVGMKRGHVRKLMGEVRGGSGAYTTAETRLTPFPPPLLATPSSPSPPPPSPAAPAAPPAPAAPAAPAATHGAAEEEAQEKVNFPFWTP